MRIEYISNYKDGTSWSKAATYNILALKEAGYDIQLKMVKYNNQEVVLHPDILNLELNNFDEVDVRIHQSLPSDYLKMSNTVKDIGLAAVESRTLDALYWKKKFSFMDGMFSCNSLTQDCLNKYGINSNIFKQSFDFDRVFSSQKTSNIKALNGAFNFLYIGDGSQLNNLQALLRAFHTEFAPYEPVNLIIRSDQNLDELTMNVKKMLKISKRCKKEISLYGMIRDEDFYTVLRHCHAVVFPHRGMSWCQSALECMATGLPIIYTEGNGLDDYVCDKSGLPIKSSFEPCYGTEGFEDLLTSNDQWADPSIDNLRYQLRTIYETRLMNYEDYLEMSKAAVQNASQYNYKNMKNEITKLMENVK